MADFEAWKRKLAARAGPGSLAPVVVDLADPRRAMREAGWGGADAPDEPPGTGVGRGSRIAEAVAGENWQEARAAEAKAARRKRRKGEAR